mmetsp:Transcript_29703/g.72362  ORF Transcript_29703/g.72362 Transcript_29703/m.72362 type:complete len:260 (-) Transcript_29703:145-924(-)|eukprot:CAMPEP_0114516356 /NCGR_PEP_ID=MMETSP0109-20121206/17282_1 /TAXON_ID=29199 /ORGANISM="Chlorarachnion reptans, Strain CCCM449" /LENGTH=259 /DNA_ID=CAMNT_0001696735 /DNA_START=63 /DNA_END=842 /DNA_ORIENTATION=-
MSHRKQLATVDRSLLDGLKDLSKRLADGLSKLDPKGSEGGAGDVKPPVGVERKVSEGPSKVSPEDVKKASELMPPQWAAKLKTILFTQEKIELRLREMARKISHDYSGKEIVAVGLLTGCVMFQMNLLKYLTVPYTLDFIEVSSYGKGTTSSGNVKMKKDLSRDPAGKHILITEDLIDTGRTLKFISKYFADKKCASVKLACLLSKSARRINDLPVDYIGFDCPDEFVIGYGMDFAGHYRALPFVGVLKEEAFAHILKK